jgi:hypothetical protein
LQWEIAMFGRSVLTTAFALVSLSSLSVPSFAEEPFRLFGCSVDDSGSDFISLYAQEHDDGTWSDLQFLVAKDGIIKTLVQDAPEGPSRFFFSNSTGSEGYYAQVRFSAGERNYVLHMLDIPPVPGDAGLGGRWGGVTITEPNGASYELPCGETDEYIGYMQQAMSCDMTNRYGAAGCDFNVRPTRAPDDKLLPGYAPGAEDLQD